MNAVDKINFIVLHGHLSSNTLHMHAENIGRIFIHAAYACCIEITRNNKNQMINNQMNTII